MNIETKARLESFDDHDESNGNIQKKTLKNKSTLRHKNVELLAVSDKRYAGKRISRKDLEEDDQSDSEELADTDENDEDENDIEEFKNKFMKEASNRSKKTKTKYEESDEDNSSVNSELDEEDENASDLDGEEESDIDEEEDDGEEEEDGEEEDEEDSNEDEVGSIDDNEENEGDVEKSARNTHDSDINKGKAIQNQLSLWDHLLECRIKLHKGINLSNQLPQAPSNFKLFTKAAGENHFVTAGQGAQTAIKTLLDNCLELQVHVYYCIQ